MEKDAPVGVGQGVGQARARMGGRDLCYCPKCQITVAHERGTACVKQKCPECGGKLTPYTGQKVKKDAPAGAGQGVGKPRQQLGGRDLCYCEKCKKTYPHERGTPCVEQKCPKCGSNLIPFTGQEIKKDTTPEEHADAKKKLYWCPVCKTTQMPKGPSYTEYKCSKCGTNLVPYTGASEERKGYKGQELCICTVCGAKYKRIPKTKCEELYCRRCGSRLSPYVGTTER